ncbi:helix-turn-helix domain-containing protein [Flavobacterium sp. SM15]|uniref:helix-turn-helix domain-containing protein n=1 Tax=Flavobacterium sp. SM15 TaxID=2908005 RepID=UPI001EDC8FE3|nr:helix-turn-helix transcriptional regulator [Flavobacterium sp. SM15]MCG2611380.1 helix-turn-helix domain-containing protein [Flavobacterium sp. SM15]
MKNTTPLKNLLGLTQEEMALLLGIHASQWSMFKSGKRSLPVEALVFFAALMKGVQHKKERSKEAQQLIKAEQEQAKEKRHLEYLRVQVKLGQVEKELELLEIRRAESFAALETMCFLEGQQEGKADKYFIQSIRSRALATLKKQSLYKLEELQLQKENLEMLKLKIENKMTEGEK